MIQKGKILIAANCRVEQVVLDAIEQSTHCKVEIEFIDSIGSKSINGLKRHLSYIKVAYHVLQRCDQYSTIIFWQQFIGIYYTLLVFLFGKTGKTAPVIILTLIYLQRNGLKGKLHRYIYEKTVNAGFISRMVCHSSTEKRYYTEQFGKINRDKFVFLPIGEGVVQPAFDTSAGDYFFAGGTSNRDYNILLNAFGEIDDKLIIACEPNDIAGLHIPENVRVLHGVYNDDFLKLMAEAKAILITLNDPNVSAGQLVLLNAMRLQKVSIITRGNGMSDYASKTNSLLSNPADKDDLITQLQYVNKNPELIRKMGIEAEQEYEDNFTYRKYGQNIGELINEISK
jgi:glycosyltransferase involved in cell wall biosynthesis